MNARYYIEKLKLEAHPEGGWFREVYRSEDKLKGNGEFPDGRNYATSIYFLITAGNFSALHRIKSDETWHFYGGDPIEIAEIDESGKPVYTVVGDMKSSEPVFQYTVRAGRWFGSRVAANGKFALAGCTVSPGFDFRDFEMGVSSILKSEFPESESLINQFTRI